MKAANVFTWCIALLVVAGSATQSAQARKPQPAPELNETGKKLQQQYADMLSELQTEIKQALPNISDEAKANFTATRKAEEAAVAAMKKVQSQLGEVAKYKGLVGHAKGKWIGGADKGIADSKARLAKATTDEQRELIQKELDNWIQNRKDGLAALEERQAGLDKALAKQPALEKELAKAKQDLEQAKEDARNVLSGLGLGPFLASDKLDPWLVKCVVLTEATPAGLAAYAQQGERQQKLVDQLLGDAKLMRRMLLADGAAGGQYGKAMEILTDIRNATTNLPKTNPTNATDKGAVLERLALAMSLVHATPLKQRSAVGQPDAPAFVNPVERYLNFEQAFLNDELDAAFPQLTTWDLRMVVDGEEPAETLTWGREMLKNYRPDHTTTPDYRWRYVALVGSDIPYGSQNVKYDRDDLQFFQNILMNGGICGRRAFIGRFMLRAHGIPTTARPQRGHAALTHWTPDGWVICLGAGWGNGWTKLPYGGDKNFLANTQMRALGKPFELVRRAQWIGDALGEPRAYGFDAKKIEFWNGAALYAQASILEKADPKALAPVGEDIAEASDSKEPGPAPGDRIEKSSETVSVAANGIITLPATATSNPNRSGGKLIFMKSVLGGEQLHIGRGGNNKAFEYTFEAPAAGKYELTALVVTPSWQQTLQLQVNGGNDAIEIALPHTVGMWASTDAITVELKAGTNKLRFNKAGQDKGVTIKEITLVPTARVAGR